MYRIFTHRQVSPQGKFSRGRHSFSTNKMTARKYNKQAMRAQTQHLKGNATCLDSENLAAIGLGSRYNYIADLRGEKAPEGVHECVRNSGARLRYDPASEAFGVLGTEGNIWTYFKPFRVLRCRVRYARQQEKRGVAIGTPIILCTSRRNAKNDN